MNVLVDTPIWSLALRRRNKPANPAEAQLKAELEELIREGRAELLGPVRQELLSGIKENTQFERIRKFLQAFQDPALTAEDFEDAARMSNTCRTRGITGTPVDMLLCAIAVRREWLLFTQDKNFVGYRKVLPLRMHKLRGGM
ncbi:MAG TPA: PIN domain-containing protein [Terriglobales bacterium]|nr:PIN domain-containing protein [Terriglobales bacterium]